ncbi:MAG: phosphotransferase, partial [Acidimicrobiia bacterium]
AVVELDVLGRPDGPGASPAASDPWPALVRAVAEVDGSRWQVVVGLRPPSDAAGVLEGKPESLIGELETPHGPALAYDATVDPELALALLEVAGGAGGAGDVVRARHLAADQSNTCVVYDERLILKLFRRLSDGPNPDVEVGRALTRVGFRSVPAQLGRWRQGGTDLAVVHEFLVGGVDGFHLALTSLHDLFEAGGPPEEAGGDFGPDARRLGAVTSELHLALVAAFGEDVADTGRWADEMLARLERLPGRDDLAAAGLDGDAVRERIEAFRAVGSGAGPSVRVHGDFHLGQVLRTDAGWYVLDFEGEPARPLEERTRPSSPLRDVAGMLRSFHYAAEVALRDYGYVDDPLARVAGAAWEERNADAFLSGYQSTEGVEALLPPNAGDRRAVMDAFLLDKAVYEVAYELAHRPGWVDIPLAAVRRLLGAGTAR